jgi:hypothetical protein
MMKTCKIETADLDAIPGGFRLCPLRLSTRSLPPATIASSGGHHLISSNPLGALSGSFREYSASDAEDIHPQRKLAA